jgi:N-acetyl-anhydromuramyl-L-alanine amidase AmpD
MKIRNITSWLLSRPRTRKPSTIVLHSSAGGSVVGSVSWLRLIGLSYTYLIDRDGTVYKLVPTTRVAFHAGKSVGPEGADVNSYSLGICFAHKNDGVEQITKAQIEACRELIRDLTAAIPSLHWLTTHYAITVKADGSYRKSDPRGFDHMQYVANGLTLWKPSFSKTFALD